MATTRVKIKQTNNLINPPDMKFEVYESGVTTGDTSEFRIHGLKVDKTGGDYELYIFGNKDYKITSNKFTYTLDLHIFYYSANLGELLYRKSDRMTASDNGYIRLSDGAEVDSNEALDNDGNIKSGYMSESKFYELNVGEIIANFEDAAIKAKYLS